MAINLKDLLQELQRKVKGKSGARMRQDEITKHAVAVAALLLDERGLSPGEARRVLTKAISLLRWEKPDVQQPENPREPYSAYLQGD